MSDSLAAAVAKATRTAFLASLRMAPDLSRQGFPMAVRLTIWPHGREFHLADVHPHGGSVRWLRG